METLNLLSDLIEAAQKAGADSADAVAVEAISRSVSWREGKLEDAEGSEGQDIGLRVLIGKRQAMVSTSDRSPDSLKQLVTRTIEMAKAVPEDPYCGLADSALLHTGPNAELELADSSDVDTDTLKSWAAEAEDAARAVNGVTNCDGAGASAGSWGITLATTGGFAGHYRGTSFSTSISAVAGSGTGMERDYDYSSARFISDLDSPATIGHNAGTRAVKRLNPEKLSSGTMPVIFDPRVSNSLLGHFAGAISGTSVARGSSFLRDKMGAQIFGSDIDIIDDPFIVRGLKSRPFDGEGVTVNTKKLVDAGVLTSWTLNSATAQQLDLQTTGHASRGTCNAPGIGLSNFYMAAGDITLSELMADIKDGIYITELIGMGVNPVTGDYSRGAAGFRIQNGILTHPVSEITIAGNLMDMFARAIPANDLAFKYGVNAPSIRINDMMVAGG